MGRKVRLITGYVKEEEARILAIWQGTRVPRCRVEGMNGDSRTVSWSTLPIADRLRAPLKRHGVKLSHSTIRGLSAGTRYRIESPDVDLDHHFETLPRDLSQGITFAIASCYYGYYRRADDYLAALQEKWHGPPRFKILTGDNLYLDVSPGQFWGNDPYRETVDLYLEYFFHSRYADVLSACPNLTTWDDHEFWNNFPETNLHLRRTHGNDRDDYRQAAMDSLDLFQRPLNPDPITSGSRSYEFRVGPVSFLIADVRSQRKLYRDRRSSRMLASRDSEKIMTWARNLEAPGILVLGQPLWLKRGDWKDYNPIDFGPEYDSIIEAILTAPYEILVISGDVHHSRLITVSGMGAQFHELVSSPACHIPDFAGVVAGSVFGASISQDQGEVSAPLKLKNGAVDLRLTKYHFGTDCPNSIGMVHLRQPHPDADVDLSCKFVDLSRNIATGSRAAAVDTTLELEHEQSHLSGRWRSEAWKANRTRCEKESVLKLKRR